MFGLDELDPAQGGEAVARRHLLARLAREIGQVTLREATNARRWYPAFTAPADYQVPDYMTPVAARWSARLHLLDGPHWSEAQRYAFLVDLATGVELPWARMIRSSNWEELGLQLLLLEDLQPELWEAVWALHALGRDR